MSTTPSIDPPDDTDLLAALGPVQRVVEARVDDPAVVDEVVQETLARLLEVRWRLDRQVLIAYGIVAARNMVTSELRTRAQHGAHTRAVGTVRRDGHYLDPADTVLAEEERAAVRQALAEAAPADRELLVRHEVAGDPVASIAAEIGASPATVGARLARARARMRLRHVLALRRTELPTPACRGVLEAVSLGDRHRQRALGASAHLLSCTVCADVSEPLLHRSRSLAGVLPFGWLLLGWHWLLRTVRSHPAASGGVATAAAAGVVLAAVLAQDRPVAPVQPVAVSSPTAAPIVRPVPAATALALSTGGTRLLPGGRVQLRSYAGKSVTGTRLLVLAVPADEGFWAGTRRGAPRVWIQLVTEHGNGGESGAPVRAGMRATFTGVVRVGHRSQPGKDGPHVEVRREQLHLSN